MKDICAIFDTDEEYARKLMNVINSRKGIIYKTIMFTSETALYEYLEHDTIQILVISENIVFEKQKKIQAKRIVTLIENERGTKNNQEEFIQQHKSVNCIKYVYKYQPAEKLICEIIGENQKPAALPLANRQITGVYSPIHYAGKTSFSLALAKAHAKSGSRTLYINLEEFSGLSEILPDFGSGSLSDAIYVYRTDRERFTKDFGRFVCNTGNISYIPPIRCAEDIYSLGTGVWMDFILYIAGLGEFETLVIDVADAAGEPWNLLEICTRVIMPIREDYISKQKIKDFDECMSKLGKEKICRITEKMLLPKDTNAQLSKDFLDMVEYGTLGRHAQEIVRRS